MKQLYMLSLSLLSGTVCCSVQGKRSQLQRKQKSSIKQKNRRGLIIGGNEARSGDYPYFVRYETPGCGGSLIAPDIVLTAGHCQLDQLSDYGTLYVGRYDPGQDNAQGFSVVSQSVHPGFDSQVCCGKVGDTWFYGVHNDFMLLKLSRESNTAPVHLNKSEFRPQGGDELYVIGFGDTSRGADFVQPDQLQEVTVNYISNQECLANSVYTQTLLTPMSMCATDRGEDACAGDSGGPLIAKGATDADDVLMGIVSWGWDCAVQPGVYSRVSAGYSWIREEVCRMSNNPPAHFRCPTPPTPQPTREPSKQPVTQEPTRTPTKDPTLRPTSEPTTRLSPFPTNRTFPSPSSIPTALASPFSTKTDMASSLPSQESLPSQNESPTSDGNIFENSTGDSEGLFFDIFPGSSENLPFKSINRRALPDGQSCSSASISSTVCCSSLSSSDDGTYGEECFPAAHGGAFESGMPCEAASWAQTNDPGAYDPNSCNLPDTAPAKSNNETGVQELTVSSLSELADRRYLPDGMSCSDLTDRRNCCQYLDNRMNKDDIYHGQPCVAVRHGFPGGICQPANYMAEVSPVSAMDCADALKPSLSLTKQTMDQFLQTLQTEILLSREPIVLKRTRLALNQSCHTITDPLVCCSAIPTEGGDCMVAGGWNNRDASSWIGQAKPRPRQSFTCIPKPPLASDSMDATTVEVEISSHTSNTVPSPSDENELLVSMTPMERGDRCEIIVEEHLRRRSPVEECSSLKMPDSCCSALDSNGQPCVIVVGRGCASMDWVVSNLANVTGIVECDTKFLPAT